MRYYGLFSGCGVGCLVCLLWYFVSLCWLCGLLWFAGEVLDFFRTDIGRLGYVFGLLGGLLGLVLVCLVVGLSFARFIGSGCFIVMWLGCLFCSYFVVGLF